MGEEFVLDQPEDFEDTMAALLRIDPKSLTHEPDADEADEEDADDPDN